MKDELAELIKFSFRNRFKRKSYSYINFRSTRSGKQLFLKMHAFFLKNNKNKKPYQSVCVSSALIDQISVLADQVQVDLYKEIENKNPVEIAKMQ